MSKFLERAFFRVLFYHHLDNWRRSLYFRRHCRLPFHRDLKTLKNLSIQQKLLVRLKSAIFRIFRRKILIIMGKILKYLNLQWNLGRQLAHLLFHIHIHLSIPWIMLDKFYQISWKEKILVAIFLQAIPVSSIRWSIVFKTLLRSVHLQYDLTVLHRCIRQTYLFLPNSSLQTLILK